MADIFSNFVLTSLGVSVVVLVVLLLKKVLGNRIYPRFHHRIDLLMVLVLLLPLLPASLLHFGYRGFFHGNLAATNASAEQLAAPIGTVGAYGMDVDFLQDFSVSVTRFFPETLIAIAAIVWLIGMAVFAVALCKCGRDLKLVKESAMITENVAINEALCNAKVEICIKRHVMLGTSILVQSPITIGIGKPFIILPQNVLESFDEDEVKHILLHELAHCKRWDSLVNLLLCLLQAVYWWNPLVYIAFRAIRDDREISCDAVALHCLPSGSALRYGETVVNFAKKLSRRETLSLAMEMGGTKRQLTKRIERIAGYKAETTPERIKNSVVFALIALTVLCQVPIVSAFATTTERGETYDFQETNVHYEDLSAYFDEYQGTFVLYDVGGDEYTVYNETEAIRRVSPASTYKLFSGLIALEEGVITPENSTINWDGTEYSIEAWNCEHDLMSGVQNSVSWYFQSLDKQSGIERLETWYEGIGYGNHDLSSGIDGYWMASSLKISPVEQVQILTALHENETQFSQENVSAMMSILRLSEKDNAVLYGKTGTVTINSEMTSGWFVGLVESEGHTFVFALHIDGDNASGSAAAITTLSILADKGIY